MNKATHVENSHNPNGEASLVNALHINIEGPVVSSPEGTIEVGTLSKTAQ